MKFEKYVPAAIIAAAILGTWIDVRGEIGDIREDFSEEIGGLREEFSEEIGGLREEVRGEISGLREEVRGEISGLRGELFTLNGRVSRIEGLLSQMLATPSPNTGRSNATQRCICPLDTSPDGTAAGPEPG